MEVEDFPTLLQALHRITELSNSYLSGDVTASIMFVRDSDGELFDVAYFHDAQGFTFYLEHEAEFL